MSARIITIEAYDPQWVERYKDEALKLREVLAGVLTAIHHIGSTAVPELAAKPTIDILLEVESLAALDGLNDGMRNMGYTPRGENGIAGRRYYIKGNGDRTHHVHAFTTGSEQAIRHLAFRDYLRKHQGVAQQYAAIKRQAAEDSRQNPAAYGRLKNEFVQRHEQLALAWLAAGESP
ncbi:GrpB family protein [Serratia marcescens]|uniref:GrpB family protein n=1 Tax=Serratia marcescens TaxID=615 RepID=UPI003ED882C0